MKQLAAIALVGGLLTLGGWLVLSVLRHDDGTTAPTPPVGAVVAGASSTSGNLPKDLDLDEPGFAERVATDSGCDGLAVFVVDDTGIAPIPGAQVLLSDTLQLWSALNANGTTVNTPSGRRIRRQLQREVITDGSGCAKFAACPEKCTIEVRAGSRWGGTTLNMIPIDNRVTVRVTEDTSVRVRVVSPSGIPRGGVPVALRRPTNAYPPFVWSLTETEEPDGVATFEHYQIRLKEGEGWRFAFGFPVAGDPTIAVDSAARAGELPVLMLEGAGRLLIRARDSQGARPQGGDLRARLSAFDDARSGAYLCQGGPWSIVPLQRNGDASVPWIGVGIRLRVEVLEEEARRGEAVLLGPLRDGEVLECEVQLGQPRLLLGRLVFRDGGPWVSQDVAATIGPALIRSGEVSSYSVVTDAEGRFRLSISEEPSFDRPFVFRLAGVHPGTHVGTTASVALGSTLPSGGLDLGDIVLDHGPLLVSGRVVDVDGEPIRFAMFTLQVADEPGPAASGEDARLFVAPGGLSAPDGSFALFERTDDAGHSPVALLSLTTRHPDYAADEARTVRLGQSGVEVVLVPAGSIEGTLDLAEGIGLADVELELMSGTDRRYSLAPRTRQFSFRSVAEGNYSLLVRPVVARFVPESRPFAEVPGLEVRPGTVCRDPRLQPLRVGDARTPATVRVVDEASQPIPSAWVLASGAVRARTLPQTNGDGLCTLRLDSIPVEAEVGAVGFRKRFVSIANVETRVVLKRGIMTRLYTSAEVVGSNPSYRMYVQLFEVDASGTRREPVIRVGPHAIDVLESGLGGAPVALSPGTYECVPRVKVFRRDRAVEGPITLESYPRVTVRESPEEQRCVIEIAQGDIDAAVAQYNMRN